MWLVLAFVILPIVEIALFIEVGGAIGALPVIALVIGSAVLGMAVMRRRGALAMLDMQRAMQEFRDPGRPMAQAALVMLAGMLLVVPGLLTSAVGLVLLIPGVQRLILRRMAARVHVVATSHGRRGFGPDADYDADYPLRDRPGPRDIDGEYTVVDDPPAPVREGLTDQGAARPGKSGWTRH
ncbi:FxsA family protein [Paracoccus sp. (in: a-proteobacteria)]|uniref:FxsA family protein n=1 Tax=Paracoccus sp. TaxID=267 RepID=UPI00321FA328